MRLPAIKVRRKPRQSRAKLTQAALLESFVRLLQEKPNTSITIRDITDVAGVGLGTFYEYFSQKEDLIALFIHLSVKDNIHLLLRHAKSCSIARTNHLEAYIHDILRYQLSHFEKQPLFWAEVFYLERIISSPAAYQKHYQLMLDCWNEMLQYSQCSKAEAAQLASIIHRLSYGLISQSLLFSAQHIDWQSLENEIITAIRIFLPAST